jgi:phosphoserine phosphatase
MMTRAEIDERLAAISSPWTGDGCMDMCLIREREALETARQLAEWLEEWVAAECDPDFDAPVRETVNWLEGRDE